MKTEKIALSGLIACLTLGGLTLTGAGCAGNSQHRSTGAYVDDKSVTARVKTALFRDPAVSGFDVNVNTYRGEVQLNGFVDTQEQKDRAAAIAREIPGVALVSNNLEVKPASSAVGSPGSAVERSSGTVIQPAPERPALDQPQTIAPVRTPSSELDQSGTQSNLLEPYRQSTTSSPGSLQENRSSASDQPIATSSSSAPPSPQNLHIDASNGKATLRGQVNSESERQEIERHVREMPGIMSIENQLEVRNPSNR